MIYEFIVCIGTSITIKATQYTALKKTYGKNSYTCT